MRLFRPIPAALACCLAGVPLTGALAAPRPAAPASRLAVTPRSFRLDGPHARQQLLVSLTAPGSTDPLDSTPRSRFTSLEPAVASVSAEGVVTPVAEGTARIRVRHAAQVTDAVVVVRLQGRGGYSFINDVQPVLTRAGCNSGACHGKAEGQGGFRLSLFGYDSEADYQAIVNGAARRRLTRVDPARSLLLLKPAGHVPHGGGTRIRPGSREYAVLAGWVASGAPASAPGEPRVTSLVIHPQERRVPMRGRQRILVTARFSDGSTRDVTHEARYASNNPVVASVDDGGHVRAQAVPGAAAVMANYAGLVATSRLLIPRSEKPPGAPPPAGTAIDRLVWNRLERLNIRPSGACTDGEFLRRAHLDLIGALPTPEEARAFLAECEAERRAMPGVRGEDGPPPKARARLVERLLQREEFADFWALKWADLLRVNKESLGAKGAYDFYRWIRTAIAENLPYDRFVREIVAATGSSAENGAVNFFRVLAKPDAMAASISQVFLGVRIECAQCHHHPFEKWSQDDYYGMVAYFTQLKSKPNGPHSVLLGPGGAGEAVHPRTGRPVPPHPLEGAPVELPAGADRRGALADWMTAPANRFVPRMIANRLWAHFLGRGLVEPVDDFRDTNPPSNPELLDALAKQLVEGGFDLKQLIRGIMETRVYRLSGKSNATNAGDEQNFSRAYPKRLSAEVLMDAVASATGTSPDLPGLPRGTRAVQVWDSEWSTQWQSYFLNVFGRPERTHPCECERSQEPSIVQVLHLMNAPEIQRQIADRGGRARRLAFSEQPPRAIVEELFLAAYARLPDRDEEAAALAAFQRAGADRVRAAEDLLWALMNTMEFVFNH